MYSLIQHITIGVILLIIFHKLLDWLQVSRHSRPIIETIIWGLVGLFIASGFWMPLL